MEYSDKDDLINRNMTAHNIFRWKIVVNLFKIINFILICGLLFFPKMWTAKWVLDFNSKTAMHIVIGIAITSCVFQFITVWKPQNIFLNLSHLLIDIALLAVCLNVQYIERKYNESQLNENDELQKYGDVTLAGIIVCDIISCIICCKLYYLYRKIKYIIQNMS